MPAENDIIVDPKGSPEGGDPKKDPDPPSPAPAAPKKDPESKADSEKSEIEKLNDQIAKQQKELEKFKTKQKEEDDKNKTAQQLLEEQKAENARLKRENLIEKIRREGDYTGKVYDALTPLGETEEEIKKSYQDHKAALDELIAQSGGKSAQGKGTTTLAPETKGKAEPDNRPYLVKIGMIKDRTAV